MSAKRRRLMFSCTLCRDRKLKCGREHPYCARCVKAGKTNECQYISYKESNDVTIDAVPLQSPDRSRRGSSICSWVNQVEEVVRVSAIVASSNQQSESNGVQSAQQQYAVRPSGPIPRASAHDRLHSFSREAVHNQELAISEPQRRERQIYLLKGRGFSARYFGPSHYTSTFIIYADLALYTRDVQRKTLPMLRAIEKAHEDVKAIGKRNPLLKPVGNICANDFLDVMPDRASMDRMIAYYLTTFETTYRILHVPSFEKQYRDYLHDPLKTPTTFLVILVLIAANMICLDNEAKIEYEFLSSTTQRQATEWITLSYRWLQIQSFKRTTLEHFQIRILLWLGKRISTGKTKRSWTDMGELVRVGILAGLHREPSHASRPISVFDQEMRRRVWATIVELEAIACLDQGMRPSISADDWDTNPPTNIDDEGLYPDVQRLPSAKALNHFTRSSFLCICSSTIGLRLRTIATINKIKSDLVLSEIDQYNATLRKTLSEIPSWYKHLRNQSASPLAYSFLRAQIYELILLIHQPQVTSSKDHGVLSLSTAIFREAAVAQLEIHKGLSEQDSLLLSCLRTTGPRAAICLCHEIIHAASSTTFLSDVTFNLDAATQLAEHAVERQEIKCIKTGVDMQPLFMMSCALSLAQEKLSVKAGVFTDKSKHQVEALQRLSNLIKFFVDHRVTPEGKQQTSDTFTSSDTNQIPNLTEINTFMLTPATSTLTEGFQGPSDIPDNFDFDFGAPILWDMNDFWIPQYPDLDGSLLI